MVMDPTELQRLLSQYGTCPVRNMQIGGVPIIEMAYIGLDKLELHDYWLINVEWTPTSYKIMVTHGF